MEREDVHVLKCVSIYTYDQRTRGPQEDPERSDSILSYPEFLAFSDPKYVKRSKKATHLKPSHTRPGWHKRGARQDRGTIASRPRATSKKPGRAETKGVCIRLVFSLRSSTFFDVRGVPMDKFLLTSSPRSLPVNY